VLDAFFERRRQNGKAGYIHKSSGPTAVAVTVKPRPPRPPSSPLVPLHSERAHWNSSTNLRPPSGRRIVRRKATKSSSSANPWTDQAQPCAEIGGQDAENYRKMLRKGRRPPRPPVVRPPPSQPKTVEEVGIAPGPPEEPSKNPWDSLVSVRRPSPDATGREGSSLLPELAESTPRAQAVFSTPSFTFMAEEEIVAGGQ